MQEAGLVGSGKTGKRPEADGQPVFSTERICG